MVGSGFTYTWLKWFIWLVQVIANTLWLGKRVDTATALLRLHHQLMPNVIYLEEEFLNLRNGNAVRTLIRLCLLHLNLIE